MTTFTRDQLIAAYRNAPEIIQDAFASERVTDIITDLQSQYGLHVDVAGKLSEEVGYLLVGLTSPTEFLQRVQEGGISAETANKIASDLNERIFIPLRELMKNPDPVKAKEWQPNDDVLEDPVENNPLPEPPQPVADIPPTPIHVSPAVPPAPSQQAPVPQQYAQMNYAPQPPVPPPYPQFQQPQYVPFGQPYMPPPQPQTYWVPVSVAQQTPQFQQPPMPQSVYQPPIYQPPQPPTAPAPEPLPQPPEPQIPSPPPPRTEPRAWEPPPNLPTGIPEQPQEPMPLRKEHGADPYREPV